MSEPNTRTRLVDESLFLLEAEQVTLRGAACQACGTTTFPVQDGCPRCGAERMAAVALPRTGTLWSFTVQGFEPKPPYRSFGAFTEYGVGYVDLGPVIVESRLTESDAQRLHVGQDMRLTTVPAFADEDGTTVLTFAFAVDGEATA
jgi:uncharacterized OB-fold protein